MWVEAGGPSSPPASLTHPLLTAAEPGHEGALSIQGGWPPAAWAPPGPCPHWWPLQPPWGLGPLTVGIGVGSLLVGHDSGRGVIDLPREREGEAEGNISL